MILSLDREYKFKKIVLPSPQAHSNHHTDGSKHERQRSEQQAHQSRRPNSLSVRGTSEDSR